MLIRLHTAIIMWINSDIRGHQTARSEVQTRARADI